MRTRFRVEQKTRKRRGRFVYAVAVVWRFDETSFFLRTVCFTSGCGSGSGNSSGLANLVVCGGLRLTTRFELTGLYCVSWMNVVFFAAYQYARKAVAI